MSALRKPRQIIGLLLVAAGWIALLADAVPAARADDSPYGVTLALVLWLGFRRLPASIASR